VSELWNDPDIREQLRRTRFPRVLVETLDHLLDHHVVLVTVHSPVSVRVRLNVFLSAQQRAETRVALTFAGMQELGSDFYAVAD